MNIDPVAAAIGFGVLLLSLTIHEAAHAWTADKLGDPTARMLGRVSLNPLVHIDWIGTVLLPIIAAISRLPLIGWAKPVPVNLRNLRHPRRDFMIVAAAGPISNFLQAFVAAARTSEWKTNFGFRSSLVKVMGLSFFIGERK